MFFEIQLDVWFNGWERTVGLEILVAPETRWLLKEDAQELNPWAV